MFPKSTLAGFAVAPLAAATFLAQTVSATPAALASRGDGGYPPPPPPGPRPCDCDKDHAPQIVKPCKGTVWHVGQRQNVTWYVRTLISVTHRRALTIGYAFLSIGRRSGTPTSPSRPSRGRARGGTTTKTGTRSRLHLLPATPPSSSVRATASLSVSSPARREGPSRLCEKTVILAEDFDIKLGYVEITVPNVYTGGDYRVSCESLSI